MSFRKKPLSPDHGSGAFYPVPAFLYRSQVMHSLRKSIRQKLCQSKRLLVVKLTLHKRDMRSSLNLMTSLKRTLTPEILDSLPEGHPDALHNRRDLRIFNAIMGNFGWIHRTLRQALAPEDSILELGAGDGGLGRFLTKKLPDIERLKYTGLDLWSQPESWPKNWKWEQCDIAQEAPYTQHSVVIGNMILHQFEPEMLATIGAHLNQHARLLIFNETARSKLSLALLPLTRLLGTNYVSNHDARVSVQSGFSGAELPDMLGLSSDAWNWKISKTSLGAYRFVARRISK